PPAAIKVEWTVVSGPAAVTFANARQAATTATFTALGDYVLKLTATDGALSTEDRVTIHVVSTLDPTPTPTATVTPTFTPTPTITPTPTATTTGTIPTPTP